MNRDRETKRGREKLGVFAFTLCLLLILSGVGVGVGVAAAQEDVLRLGGKYRGYERKREETR